MALKSLPLIALAALCLALPAAAQTDAAPVVELRTSAGAIRIELVPDRAPQTVANFLRLVDSGFYRGLQFHRVVPGFVAQGGG